MCFVKIPDLPKCIFRDYFVNFQIDSQRDGFTLVIKILLLLALGLLLLLSVSNNEKYSLL